MKTPSWKPIELRSDKAPREVGTKRQFLDEGDGDCIADDSKDQPGGSPMDRRSLESGRPPVTRRRTGGHQNEPGSEGHDADGYRTPRQRPAEMCVVAAENPQDPGRGHHAQWVEPIETR